MLPDLYIKKKISKFTRRGPQVTAFPFPSRLVSYPEQLLKFTEEQLSSVVDKVLEVYEDAVEYRGVESVCGVFIAVCVCDKRFLSVSGQ